MKALKKKILFEHLAKTEQLLSEWMLREWQEMAGMGNQCSNAHLLKTTVREPTAKSVA